MAKLHTPVNEHDHRAGNAKAGVTLVEYGDYQCPHCKVAHPFIKKLLEEKGDDFLFVFRNFPLQESHPLAFMAAAAAEAAGRQDRFWEMHDLIFDRQDDLERDTFIDLAEELQLDMQRFATDWRSNEIAQKVEDDFESGMRSGVNGTPTFYLNGELLHEYNSTYKSLLNAIESAGKHK